MKILMPGPLAGYGWQHTIESWAPGQVVDLPDDNKQAVAWGRAWLGMGAVLVEDVQQPESAKPSTVSDPAPRRGRPPLPRDAEGNVIRQ